jgi:hypothetical protein
MVVRNQAEYIKLLKDQYDLLKDAVSDFYAGKEARANDVAVRIRVLVHNTQTSKALLSYLTADYMKMLIYHKPTRLPNAVFVLKQPIRFGGDGKCEAIRDDFTNVSYELVPLERWWTEDYLVIGRIRSSKKQVVLDVANKDGGAHVDEEVPVRHAAASKPPVAFGVNRNPIRPNLARSTVAQAGNELLDFIERHFPSIVG